MSRTTAGAWAGAVAGVAMAALVMVWTAAGGDGLWVHPNRVAAMWLGPGAVSKTLGGPTVIGLATHLAVSGLLGVVGVWLIRDLPPRRKIATSIVFGLAVYTVLFGLVLSWANPLLVAQSPLPMMAVVHAVFGVVLALVYLRLRPGVPFNAQVRSTYR